MNRRPKSANVLAFTQYFFLAFLACSQRASFCRFKTLQNRCSRLPPLSPVNLHLLRSEQLQTDHQRIAITQVSTLFSDSPRSYRICSGRLLGARQREQPKFLAGLGVESAVHPWLLTEGHTLDLFVRQHARTLTSPLKVGLCGTVLLNQVDFLAAVRVFIIW